MDWESIVKRGVESDELDYKAAQNWNKLSRTGRAKFARHCMALANTKGGYVVVGVGEDEGGRPALFTGLTEEEMLSFDPTEIGTFVNRFPIRRWNSRWNVRWWMADSMWCSPSNASASCLMSAPPRVSTNCSRGFSISGPRTPRAGRPTAPARSMP